jgi:nucleotide-binding universal stress UspA family protein
MEKVAYAVEFARLFKARVHVIGLQRPGETEYEKRMRDLCDSIKEHFEAEKIAAETEFTSTADFPGATLRSAHAHARSLVIVKQDHDFLLAELFHGSFSKTLLRTVLSPVLIVPGSI